MSHAIAGGGIAALAAIRAIRRVDAAARITLVSAEDPCCYFRPMTPLVVRGERRPEDLRPEADALAGVRVVTGRATSLDAAARVLGVEGGERIPYERLLIATGSSPCVPEIAGVGEPNVHYLRTLADALALREAARPGAAAVVLGGGFVGIKTAEALAQRGVAVTVVEREGQILLPRLDAAGAALVAAALEARGIALALRDTIAEILPRGRGVRLASGRALASDFVCIAVGVRPSVAWLAGSGVAVEKAVVVDERGQTSLPGVYAAGDVAQIRDPVSGRSVVSALWTNAVQMGRVAGTNMAGGTAAWAGGPEVFNAAEIEGVPMVSVGEVLAEGERAHRVRRGPVYRKLVLDGDVLSGAIFLGEVRNAGVYSALIAARTPLGRLKDKALAGTLTYADVALGR
ncbi:MAG TPA: FAD-dependent oxidoreductase [bacterium]